MTTPKISSFLLAFLLVAGSLFLYACSEAPITEVDEPELARSPDASAALPLGAEGSDLPPSAAKGTQSQFNTLAVGTMLDQFTAPVPGNGIGLAFDGTDLYYSIAHTTIHKVSTGGVPLASIPNGSNRPIGALAWDPTGGGGAGSLWAGTFDAGPLEIYELDPTNGGVRDVITNLPVGGTDPQPTFLTGLAYDPATNSLFYSTDLGDKVFQISATHGPATVLSSFTTLTEVSGHAFDGSNLYNARPVNDEVVITDASGNVRSSFPTPSGVFTADLAFDGVTFAPKCAVWSNEVTIVTSRTDNRITAQEVDCPTNGVENGVEIDIKPGGFPNAINTRSMGAVPVALLGSATFEVADVDVTTLSFGPAGATPIHKDLGHLEDANGDGFIDLVSHYRQKETGLVPGDTEACVTGMTTGGAPIEGCDSVDIVR